MSIERFFVTPVTIIEPGSAPDGYNGTAPDWTDPTETTVYGWLTQTGTTEDIVGRDVSVSGWMLFLPAGTTISAVARVTSGGRTYEVDGAPNLSPATPSGQHHIEVRLRVVSEVTA